MGIAALLGAKQPGLLLRPPDEQHPLGAGESRQVLVHDVVLALTLDEIDPRHPPSWANRRNAVVNPSLIDASGAVEATGNPNWRCT